MVKGRSISVSGIPSDKKGHLGVSISKSNQLVGYFCYRSLHSLSECEGERRGVYKSFAISCRK